MITTTHTCQCLSLPTPANAHLTPANDHHYPHLPMLTTTHTCQCSPLPTPANAHHYPHLPMLTTTHTCQCSPLPTPANAHHYPHLLMLTTIQAIHVPQLDVLSDPYYLKCCTWITMDDMRRILPPLLTIEQQEIRITKNYDIWTLLAKLGAMHSNTLHSKLNDRTDHWVD